LAGTPPAIHGSDDPSVPPDSSTTETIGGTTLTEGTTATGTVVIAFGGTDVGATDAAAETVPA